MPKSIHEWLAAMETRHGIRILFACESGSRAWGFPSPDSDFDVRFIYVQPLEAYLRIDAHPDTIEKMAPGDLDFGGWDLRKALSLFAGCNLPLNEWLGSPIVYEATGPLRTDLAALIPAFFNSRKAYHHYSRLAANTAEKHLLSTGEMGIKKLFYILRPLYACRWIERTHSMPPTRFHAMLGQDLAKPEIEAWIHNLLKTKESAAEGDRIDIPPAPLAWLAAEQARLTEAIETLPVTTTGTNAQLNQLFQAMVTGE